MPGTRSGLAALVRLTVSHRGISKGSRWRVGFAPCVIPSARASGDLPEAELLPDAIRQDLPAARVPLHEWFRRWDIRSFPGGAVCAVPLEPPYVSRIVELRDFYACLRDYEKIFRHLPEDLSPFAPGALTEVAAALEELQLKPPTRKQSDEAAARKKLYKKKDEDATERLQRQMARAVIDRVYQKCPIPPCPARRPC